MMKKTDLVKLITKKAGISDSSAKEFFDVFLRKIAEELEPGESARFSNLGYFHFRRGEIKKQDDLNETKKVDYLDLIIFSPSSQLNIKSHDNVVFSVSQMHDGVQDALDAHFSLSIGKPVLPQLEGKEIKDDEDHHSEENYRELERKARSLMTNLHPDDSIRSKGEILLVDIRSIDSDQFELELNDDAKKKNAVKKTEASIHSSENLKSKAWDFGNILSKQIEEREEAEEKVESKQEQKGSDSTKWDFGKRYWDSTPKSKPVSENKQNALETGKPGKPKNEIDDLSEEDLGDELFDLEDDISGIEMDDFKIPEEEDKMGKFERVRSIRSSLQDISDEEITKKSDKFLDPEYDLTDPETDDLLERFNDKFEDINATKEDNGEKPNNFLNPENVTDNSETDEMIEKFNDKFGDINSTEEDIDKKQNDFLNPQDDYTDSETNEMLDRFKDKIGDISPTREEEVQINEEINDTYEEKPVTEEKSDVEIKLNRVERKNEHLKYERKNTGSSVLKIFAVLVIIIGGLYLLFKESGNGEVSEEIPQVGKNDNTTYVERTYDVPVTYPYDKKEGGQDISGIDLSKEENKGNETVTKKDVVENTTKQEPIKQETNNNPKTVVNNVVNNASNNSNEPVLVTSNIYNYGDYFVVQVSAFRDKQVAENTVVKYNSLGFKAFIETIQINSNDWYRVRVGNFKTLQEAQNFNNSKN